MKELRAAADLTRILHMQKFSISFRTFFGSSLQPSKARLVFHNQPAGSGSKF